MNAGVNSVNSGYWGILKSSALPQPWPPEERFWDRLSRLQRALGLENADIAKIAGVHVGTVSAWRRRNPNTDQLLALARYFKVTPEWLLNGTDVLHERGSPLEPPKD